jgi:hypothetical protein
MKRLALVALIAIGALCGVFLMTRPTSATVTDYINFQGKLTNTDGTNVADNTYTVVFSIYSVSTGGSAVWTESKSVTVSGGLFQTNLGDTTTLPGSVNFNSNSLYLGIKVGADAEMTPRVQLTAAPQAINSDMLDGLDSTNFVQLSAGNVNIGTGTITSGAVNGLTLTQAADGFTVAGGTTSRTLTVTGANITVGSTIQPTAAGSLIVQSNGANALTLTSGAAATWSTTAGLLTVQGFGGVTVNSPAASGATGALTIQTGNSSAGTAGNVTIDTGTTSTGTPTITIANANAKAVQIGNNTSNPGVTIDSGTGTIALGTGAQARTINLGTGGAAQAVTVGSTTGASALTLQAGTGNLSLTTQGTGQLNVGANAVAQTVNVGNTTGATAVTLQAGTGGLNITTQGTGALNIGNNAVAQTINLGNATGATTVSVLCGTGTCGFGNNAIAHATIVGSTTGAAATTLQAGTGGLVLTSGTNITLGAVDATATLFVFDNKNTTGDPAAVNGGEYYNSANNKFRCTQNSIWSDCTTGFNSSTLSADQAATQSSITMQNVPALGFTANANTTYVFDAWIPVNDSNATADFKYTFTTPTSSTLNILTDYYSTATTNVICNIITSGTVCANATVNIANHFVEVRGQVITVGTAGTVQFQFAQNTSTAASFPIIKKGAVITWKQSN